MASLLVVGALGALGLAATAQPSSAGVRLTAEKFGASSATPQRAVEAVRSSAGSITAEAPATAAAPARSRPPSSTATRSHLRAKGTTAHGTARARYIPAGTGMWIYEWRRTNHGNARSIVHRARQTGLSTLYVRTGSSWDGFEGGRHLRRLLGAARGTGVRVVAWDFPRLRRPARDAHPLARAARGRTPGGPERRGCAPRAASMSPPSRPTSRPRRRARSTPAGGSAPT